MRQVKVSLRKVKLNRQGYEVGRFGSYYGVGRPLYRVTDPDGKVHELRADDRDAAEERVRSWFAATFNVEAVFYRVPVRS